MAARVIDTVKAEKESRALVKKLKKNVIRVKDLAKIIEGMDPEAILMIGDIRGGLNTCVKTSKVTYEKGTGYQRDLLYFSKTRKKKEATGLVIQADMFGIKPCWVYWKRTKKPKVFNRP